MQAFLVSLLELALFEIGLALSKHTTYGKELDWWCVQLADFPVVGFERLQPETFYIQNTMINLLCYM